MKTVYILTAGKGTYGLSQTQLTPDSLYKLPIPNLLDVELPQYSLLYEDYELYFMRDNEIISRIDLIDLQDDADYTIGINGNVLSLYQNGNEISKVDVSPYLDDTNLARITSGVLDEETGIVTFSRDDTSTFTIDFSALLGDNSDVNIEVDRVLNSDSINPVENGTLTYYFSLINNASLRNTPFTNCSIKYNSFEWASADQIIYNPYDVHLVNVAGDQYMLINRNSSNIKKEIIDSILETDGKKFFVGAYFQRGTANFTLLNPEFFEFILDSATIDLTGLDTNYTAHRVEYKIGPSLGFSLNLIDPSKAGLTFSLLEDRSGVSSQTLDYSYITGNLTLSSANTVNLHSSYITWTTLELNENYSGYIRYQKLRDVVEIIGVFNRDGDFPITTTDESILCILPDAIIPQSYGRNVTASATYSTLFAQTTAFANVYLEASSGEVRILQIDAYDTAYTFNATYNTTLFS